MNEALPLPRLSSYGYVTEHLGGASMTCQECPLKGYEINEFLNFLQTTLQLGQLLQNGSVRYSVENVSLPPSFALRHYF